MSPKELSAKLEGAAKHLLGVERKRMPGGYALFVGGKIFANVTVDGRIGVKLPVPWCLEELAALPGAAPWTLGKKVMEHWVLLPTSLHDSDAAIREWVTRAYACATGKVPTRRPDPNESPPTTRSIGVEPSSRPEKRSDSPQNGVHANVTAPVITETPPLPPIVGRRSSRSIVPAPPSSNGIDLSSYAPPPPSSVGIRVVPKDSKSIYEETLVGVPAPPSSRVDLDDD